MLLQAQKQRSQLGCNIGNHELGDTFSLCKRIALGVRYSIGKLADILLEDAQLSWALKVQSAASSCGLLQIWLC